MDFAFPPDVTALVEQVSKSARAQGVRIATAESCTGGLVAAALTAVAGSSDVFDRGFVTYSNDAKIEMLKVEANLIASHGAVSREVALAMAACALKQSRAQLAIAVTGIAGPAGGSLEKPVGLVHFAAARVVSREDETVDFTAIHHEERYGDASRDAIRAKSIKTALQLLLRATKLS